MNKKTIAKPKKSGRKRTSALQKTIESKWPRFAWESTTKETRERFFGLLFTTASFSLPAPCSHEGILKKICEQAGIPIMTISEKLAAGRRIRGTTVFGLVGDRINSLAFNYPGIYWWFSEEGLVVDEDPWESHEDFDQIAGKLFLKPVTCCSKGNISPIRIIRKLPVD